MGERPLVVEAVRGSDALPRAGRSEVPRRSPPGLTLAGVSASVKAQATC